MKELMIVDTNNAKENLINPEDIVGLFSSRYGDYGEGCKICLRGGVSLIVRDSPLKFYKKVRKFIGDNHE